MTKTRTLRWWALLPIPFLIGSTACSTGAKNYDGFVQMVEHENNYSCAALIDAVDGLSTTDEANARRLLDTIGCSSESGTRNDRS